MIQGLDYHGAEDGSPPLDPPHAERDHNLSLAEADLIAGSSIPPSVNEARPSLACIGKMDVLT
jgi:hypothetical protein